MTGVCVQLDEVYILERVQVIQHQVSGHSVLRRLDTYPFLLPLHALLLLYCAEQRQCIVFGNTSRGLDQCSLRC